MKSKVLPAYVAGLYAFMYLPLAVMVAFSFNDARRNVVWKGFTLQWYVSLFHNAPLMSSLWTTVELAFAASLLATALGLLASYALTRHPSFRGKGAYHGLLNVPLMMPEIVMGVGLLSFFSRARLPLSFWTLAGAHALIALPYTVSSIRARLSSLKESRLEEAAMDLGATEWQAFRWITLPLAKPALISGALLAFTVSFEDFITSFFIKPIGLETMPIRIYSMMKFGVTPEINALATCLLLLTVALLAGSRLLTKRT
jgi:spermidine/putrescine transport system permease protein